MKNFLRLTAVLLAGLALNWACVPSAPVAAEPAPPLSGPGLDGKTVSLSDYAGKVVLVDFWATWCDPCKEEIPELGKLHEKLGPKGFVVLGASMDEETKEVAPFAKKAKIAYPVIVTGSERAQKGWIVPGLPTAYLVGRDGKMRGRWFGSKSMAKIEREIEAALAK